MHCIGWRCIGCRDARTRDPSSLLSRWRPSEGGVWRWWTPSRGSPGRWSGTRPGPVRRSSGTHSRSSAWSWWGATPRSWPLGILSFSLHHYSCWSSFLLGLHLLSFYSIQLFGAMSYSTLQNLFSCPFIVSTAYQLLCIDVEYIQSFLSVYIPSIVSHSSHSFLWHGCHFHPAWQGTWLFHHFLVFNWKVRWKECLWKWWWWTWWWWKGWSLSCLQLKGEMKRMIIKMMMMKRMMMKRMMISSWWWKLLWEATDDEKDDDGMRLMMRSVWW